MAGLATFVNVNNDESTSTNGFDEHNSNNNATNNDNTEISRRLVEYFVVVSSVPKKVMGNNNNVILETNNDLLLSSSGSNDHQGKKKNNNIPSPLRRNQSSQVAAARLDIRRAHLGRYNSEGMGTVSSSANSGGASAAAASFKNLEKKLENMKLDKTLTKLEKTMASSRPLTPTSMMKGDNKKRGKGIEERKNQHQQQPFDEVDESFSSEDLSVSSMDVANNVEGGSTFRPSFIVPVSPPPIPSISPSLSEEKSTTPRIAPLPERKTVSSLVQGGGGGVSENIRLDDDTINQQQQQYGNNNNDGSTLSNCI